MDDKQRQNLFRYASAGVEFAVTFGIMFGGGLLLDLHLKTLPGFAILGGILGFLGAVRRLARQGRQIQKDLGAKQEGPDQKGSSQ